MLLLLLLKRQNREVLIPAGSAAERRNMQIPPDNPKQGVHMFGRDALQRGIAANRAMGVERIAERHQSRVESGMASLATPRVQPECAEDIVRRCLAARSARTILLADGTIHLGR
jgi:hypothetical protein